MKRVRFFLLAILFILFAVNISNTHADTADDITSLENQYFQALDDQDQKKMDSLLSDEFVISSMSSNWSMTKEEFLKTVPKQVITSWEIAAVKVDVEGDRANSQVVIGMTKTFDGKDHSGDYEVYSVWVKKDDSWKLVERKIKFLN